MHEGIIMYSLPCQFS